MTQRSVAADDIHHRGLAAYRTHKTTTVIPTPEEFVTTGIAEIVNQAAQSYSCNCDGLTRLVNAAIQIVEESYVVFSAVDHIERCYRDIADHSTGYLKANSTKDERAEILKLGDALDEYGNALVLFHGPIAGVANLKIRVLSRLLLVNAMRPILDTYKKTAEIDYSRLNRINSYRMAARRGSQ